MYPYVRDTGSLTVYCTSSSSYTGALERAPKTPRKWVSRRVNGQHRDAPTRHYDTTTRTSTYWPNRLVEAVLIVHMLCSNMQARAPTCSKSAMWALEASRRTPQGHNRAHSSRAPPEPWGPRRPYRPTPPQTAEDAQICDKYHAHVSQKWSAIRLSIAVTWLP